MADTSNPLVRRRAAVGLAIETTSGTAVAVSAALTATDVFDASCEPVDLFSQTERRPHGQFNSRIKAPVGMRVGRFRFTINLSYGSALTSNQILMRLLGYALDTGVYKPVTAFGSRPKTFSMALQQDGRQHNLYGCVADCTIEIEVGKIAKANFDGMGVWSSTTDVALVTQSQATTMPWTGTNMAVTVANGAGTPTEIGACNKATIRFGNQIAPREDFTVTPGVHYFYIADRSPSIVLEPEARLVATFDHFGDMLASGERAINIELDNGTNTLDFDAPKAQRTNITYSERENRHIDVLEFACNANAGDDELTVTASA